MTHNQTRAGGLLAAVACALAGGALAAPTAADVVRRVDEIRNPQMDYTVKIAITERDPAKAERVSHFEVFIKGRDKTFVRQTLPVAERDRLMLMRERIVWTYFPKVSQPLRLSLQQRLAGDVAVGDVTRANFTGDYQAAFMPQPPAERKTLYKIELKALAEEVTYGRVILWARRDNFRPVKAEFYAVSGRLLKSATYENYKSIGGAVRPARVVIRDAVVKAKQSVMEYDSITLRDLPEKYFTRDHMKKLAL